MCCRAPKSGEECASAVVPALEPARHAVALLQLVVARTPRAYAANALVPEKFRMAS